MQQRLRKVADRRGRQAGVQERLEREKVWQTEVRRRFSLLVLPQFLEMATSRSGTRQKWTVEAEAKHREELQRAGSTAGDDETKATAFLASRPTILSSVSSCRSRQCVESSGVHGISPLPSIRLSQLALFAVLRAPPLVCTCSGAPHSSDHHLPTDKPGSFQEAQARRCVRIWLAFPPLTFERTRRGPVAAPPRAEP